jgi:predicted tellurium resistance membrane protein TerC
MEIHNSLEGEEEAHGGMAMTGFAGVLVQIALLDIIFSLDSVITAVGLARQLPVMVLAIVIAVGVMMLAARAIGEFVDAHPTIKMLALSFLILIGVTLVADGLSMHIPKGYVYFAMAFSTCVEMLNLRVRKRKSSPLQLRKPVQE